MDFLNAKMDELAGLLETIEIEKNETAETLADKIEKLIKGENAGALNEFKEKNSREKLTFSSLPVPEQILLRIQPR
jgi:hypothetical protein